jgi:hypothetical protein
MATLHPSNLGTMQKHRRRNDGGPSRSHTLSSESDPALEHTGTTLQLVEAGAQGSGRHKGRSTRVRAKSPAPVLPMLCFVRQSTTDTSMPHELCPQMMMN